MASSLLFRIKAVLDAGGFKDARTAFTDLIGEVKKLTKESQGLDGVFSKLFGSTERDALGVAVNQSATGIQRLSKGLLSLKGVAALVGVAVGVELVKGLGSAVKEAARSELSFVRLQAQLDALGLASEKNLKRITEFAERTAVTTRFSSNEVEQAVTQIVRRTNDLDLALDAVKVAQDLAASSGEDLGSAASKVTQALTGNARAIRLLTGASQAQIKTAIAQGKVLDLLRSRLAGIAEKEADTVIGKFRIIGNLFDEIGKNIGDDFLPAIKLVQDGFIALQKGVLVFEKTFGILATPFDRFQKGAKNGAEFARLFEENLKKTGNTSAALIKTFRDLAKSIDEVGKSSKSIGDEEFELTAEIERQGITEIQNIEERQDKLREFNKALALSRLIRQGDVRATKEQAEEFKDFATFQKAVDEGRVERARDVIEARKKEIAAQNELVNKRQEQGADIKAVDKAKEDAAVLEQTLTSVVDKSILSLASAGSKFLTEFEGKLKPLEPKILFNIDPIALGAKMAEIAKREIDARLAQINRGQERAQRANQANSGA